jgi:hypothetical protein
LGARLARFLCCRVHRKSHRSHTHARGVAPTILASFADGGSGISGGSVGAGVAGAISPGTVDAHRRRIAAPAAGGDLATTIS